MPWFDAHLDLAYLAVCGRPMSAPLADARVPHPPASVTFPSLREGGITACLATIFTEAVLPGGAFDQPGVCYRAGDVDEAEAAGRVQLSWYHAWARQGLCSIDAVACEPRASAAPLHLAILVEGADPIRSPELLQWWVDRGVAAIGLTWARGTRYAAGNAGPATTGEPGLTRLGREMVVAMDACELVHDASHLSDRATLEILDLARGPIMASHSNCRALLDPNDRHLSDEAIRALASRRPVPGVIGLNLCSAFLGRSCWNDGRATIDDCVAHVEHACDLARSRACVGLGSDLDGGFSAERLPLGIERPIHLRRILDALGARGWSDADLEGFSWRNWARFWRDAGRPGLAGAVRAPA